MRKFMSGTRLWAGPDSPQEDWIKPHVLWLPQDSPQVIAYFKQLREIVVRYPDVLTSITDEDLHLTIQSVRQHDRYGHRVDDELLHLAAAKIQNGISDLEPFEIEIGPARASGAAALASVWPETGPAELNRRVRDGLLAAGCALPPAEEYFWPHMSCGYGVQDTDTPELAARSDRFASEIGKSIRPGIRTSATVSSIWLVWERQDPDRNVYTFERVVEMHLGTA